MSKAQQKRANVIEISFKTKSKSERYLMLYDLPIIQ
jgi:hypothetical protein